MTTMLKGSHAEDEMNKDAGYIVGKLFKAAKKRLEHSELKPEVTSFILKCEDEPEKCLLEVWSEEEKPAEKKHKKKKGKGALSSFYALPVEDKELSELSPEEEEIIKTHPGMKERIEADAADTSSAEGIADSIERKVRAGEKKKKQQKEEMVEEEEGEEEPCDETENQEQLVEVPQKQATKKQRKHALVHTKEEPELGEDKELSELSPEEEEIIKTHPGMKERIEADAADTSSAEGIADSMERKVMAGERKKKQPQPSQETEKKEQMVVVPQRQATKKQRKHALAHATAKHVPERKVKAKEHMQEKSEKPRHKRVKQRAGGHKKARA